MSTNLLLECFAESDSDPHTDAGAATCPTHNTETDGMIVACGDAMSTPLCSPKGEENKPAKTRRTCSLFTPVDATDQNLQCIFVERELVPLAAV